MRKLMILLWCLLLVLPVSVNDAYAFNNPTVTYDASMHEFAVENTNDNDFFNGMKNVMPGDTKVQVIDLQYTHVSQDLSVYLTVQCDDQEILHLLSDATMDIYVDGKLISENQWLFDRIFIGQIQNSGLHEMEVHIHIPTSIGNEIAGKTMLLNWILTVQEVEAQESEKNPDVSVVPDDNMNISQSSNTTLSQNEDNESMISAGQTIQNDGVALEGELDKDNGVGDSTIINESIPLSGVKSSWALVNLIALIITIIVTVFMFIRKQNKDKETEQGIAKYQRRRWIPICGIGVTVISFIVFVLTEDMTLKMTYIDQYTIWMIILLVINIVLALFGRTWKEIDIENE